MKTIVLSISLLLLAGFMNLSAQTTGNWNSFAASAFEAGSGDGSTPAKAFLIKTPEQLAFLAKNVSLGNDYQNTYFRLLGNLDLISHHWTPIGTFSTPFKGHLNGSGYRIANVSIQTPGTDYTGLFGVMSDGSIDSLGVVQASIQGKNYAGAFIGWAENVQVQNSYAVNNTQGDEAVGGMIGYADKVVLSNNYSSGIVKANNKAGGLVGECYSTVIAHSYSSAMVTVTQEMAGGLTGYIGISFGTASIKNCVAANVILSANDKVNRITGYQDAGVTLENNYAFADMSVNRNPVTSTDADNENGQDKDLNILFTESFYTGSDFSLSWDFNNVWHISETHGLPNFSYQNSTTELISVKPELITGNYDTNQIPDSVVVFSNGQQTVLTATDFDNGIWTMLPSPSLRTQDIIWATIYEPGKRPAAPAWDFINPFAEGFGSDDFPYGISTVEELDAIRTVADKAYAFILLDSIDISTYPGWVPIGNTTTPFKGKFNGNGFTISGLNIETTQDNQGLFGVVDNSRFENLFLRDVSIKGGNNTGALAGKVIGTTNIEKCAVTGQIKGKNRVGGLLGEATGVTVENAYAITNMQADNMAGGIVGYLSGSTGISHAYAGGTLVMMGNYAGGIAGQCLNANINYCVNALTSITAGTFIDKIAGSYSGGSVDWNYSLSTLRINEAKQVDSNSRSLSELQSRTFYEQASLWNNNAWDFNNVWQIQDNLSYPYFISQDSFPSTAPSLPFAGGNGTKLYPCLISTAEELDKIRDYKSEEYYFQLINDIDLSTFGKYTPANAGNWLSIGDMATPFEGHLNGSGHVISNMTINRPTTDSQGLFGCVKSGSLDSLGMLNVSVKGRSMAGGLSGMLLNTHISGCFVTGSIVATTSLAGGLSGAAQQQTQIDNCYFMGDVSGMDYIGGITGSAPNAISISDVYAMGKVSGRNQVGGLIGESAAPLSSSFSVSMVQGQNNLGTLVGKNNAVITNCYTDKSFCRLIDPVGLNVIASTPQVTLLFPENFVSQTSLSGLGANWQFKNKYYPHLKVFSTSSNPTTKAASALSAVPVLFGQEAYADSICFAFPLYKQNTEGDTLLWQSGITGILQDTIATTLQANFQQDTLIVKDATGKLQKRIYYAPYHLKPDLRIEVKSGNAAYMGDWTNQDILFSLTNRKALISGDPIIRDSIWNAITQQEQPWKVIPSSYVFDRDTSLVVSFRPIGKTGMQGDISSPYTVKLDKTLPELSVTYAPAYMRAEEQAPDSVVFTVNYSDNLSGIRRVSWETIGLTPEKSGIIRNTGNSFKLDSLGAYKVKIMATDSAGNESVKLLDAFVREKRQDSTLVRLNANGEEIQLKRGVSDYTISPVGYDQSQINVIAITNDSYATSDNQGTYPLQVGENIITITTSAEQRDIKGTYRIRVYRKSNDFSFSAFNIGGKNVTLVNGQYEYQVTVSSSTKSVEPIYSLTHPNAVCDIQSKYYLGEVKTSKDIRFIVTAEDASYFKEYTMTVYRQNNVNTLKTLNIGGINVVLDKDKYAYTVTVPSTVTNVNLSYTTEDPNAICDAQSNYVLPGAGQDLDCMVTVSAEDRNIQRTYQLKIHRQSNKAAISTIIVNGVEYDPENLPEIALDCSSDAEQFQVQAEENGTVSYIFNGVTKTTEVYVLELPGPGKYEIQVVITPEDATQPTRSYTIHLVKWFGDEIFFSRWKNVLSVKSELNGYTFEKVKWYKEGNNQELSGNPSLGYISIPEEANYYVVLEGTGPGGHYAGIRSCSFPFQFSDIYITVAPNPVARGQMITISAKMPEAEKTGATMKLTSSTGVFIFQIPLKGEETKMVAPNTAGIYILQITTGSGITREFKIIVQ